MLKGMPLQVSDSVSLDKSIAFCGIALENLWLFIAITYCCFVMQGLASLVLKPMEESDLSPMDTSISAVAALLPSYNWLLVRLPSLPLFECVKMNICSDLRHVSSNSFLLWNCRIFIVFEEVNYLPHSYRI